MATAIEFTAHYGDETKQVKLSNPSGGEGYQVLIDNFYQGSIFKKGDRWVGHINDLSELTSDDILILGDIIDDAIE